MEFLRPFANTGEKEDFSVDTDPDGAVSLEKGFTILYELKPEEGGLFILRKVFNQMMFLVSSDTVKWKTQTFPDWIADAGSGIPFAYSKNAVVKYTDGNSYVSKVNSNTELPTNPTKWSLFDVANFVTLDGDQIVGGLKEFSKTPIIPLKIIATGTTTFTATTNNINLTGIGIGVEIGDVIQISGAEDAKNNSEFTIEVIKDANNVIVNQAHANKGTTKNVASRLSDTDVTVKLLAKWYNADSDLGRDWVDVTANRSRGVTYPNNTKRPIPITIRTGSSVAAVTTITTSNISDIYYQCNQAGFNISGYIEISRGSSYLVDGGVILRWSEKR